MTDGTGTLFDVSATHSFGGEFYLREVNATTAKRWCSDLDYTGTFRTGHRKFGGFYGPDERSGQMAVLVTVGPPGNPHGIAKKYGLERWRGNLEVGRIVPDPAAPPGSILRTLNAVAAIYRPSYDWLFAYTDPRWDDAVEDTLMAVGMIYVGDVRESAGWMLDGVPTANKTVVSRFGGQGKDTAPEIARQLGHTLERRPGLNTVKRTYVWPLSERRSILAHLDAIREAG